MDTILLVGRLLLAVVFIAAGVGKLADRAGSRRAMAEFGVPDRVGRPAATMLPLAELMVGAGVVLSATGAWAAAGALVLLLLFVVAIAVNLARGRQPDCHCFGQLHSSPAGWPTLIRNVTLAAIAGLVLWQEGREPGAGALDRFVTELSALQAVVGVGVCLVVTALGLLVWLAVHLLRQQGRLLIRIEALESAAATGTPVPAAAAAVRRPSGLPVGDTAPEFTLPDIDGGTLTLATLRDKGKPVMLLFSAAGCGPCEALMPEVGRWQRDHDAELTIAVISTGPAEAIAAIAGEHGLMNVARQDGSEVAKRYRYLGTPGAVIVSADGRITTPVVGGADAVRGLLSEVIGGPATALDVRREADREPHEPHRPPPAPRIGDPVPPVRLHDLDGATVDLAKGTGTDRVVVFWNPSCRFCEQMLPDLKAWEADPPEGAPALVVVSTGAIESNRAMGLRSSVLLDGDSSAIRAFGVSGTPIAVRLAADGTVASAAAVGKPDVLRMLGIGHGATVLEESQRR